MAHPEWLSEPLTHIDVFPFNLRVDVTGMVAFLVSVVAFFFLQLTPGRCRDDDQTSAKCDKTN